MKEVDGHVSLFGQRALTKKDPDFLKFLDDEQIEPVKALNGPVLVLAGAGSGKTRVLVYRVANMLYNGIRPEQILMMTFTKRAATEMRDRVSQLVGGSLETLTCGTFHHVGNKILRRYADVVGLARNYTIMDEDDVKSLMKLARGNVGLEKDKRLPKDSLVRSIMSLSVNKCVSVEDIIMADFPDFLEFSEEIREIALEYMRLKKKNNVVDYDDILLYWKLILEKNEHVRRSLQDEYRYLLVDEYQDTNHLQSEIIRLMVGERRNIMAVGDPNQSIYRFRGAEIGHILKFEEMFEDSRVFKVSYNYRSVPEILTLANDSIKNNETSLGMQLKPFRDVGGMPEIYNFPDSNTEASYFVERIEELMREGVALKDIAVLYRNHFFAKDMEIALTRANIPYELRSGVKFFEKKHVKDIVTFVRLNYNLLDEVSWSRVLGQYDGLGNKTIATILSKVLEGSHEDVRDYVIGEESFAYVKRGRESFMKFMGTLKRTVKMDRVQDIVDAFVEDHYGMYMKKAFENAEDRLEDVTAIVDYSLQYETIEEFLEDVTLLEDVMSEDTKESSDEDTDRLVLSTIHRSKGLEWPYVFLIGCVEGKFPSEKSKADIDLLEEERRLFYVAVTRAERSLNISHVSMQYDQKAGYRVTANPSEFLMELDESVYKYFKYSH